MLFVTPTLSLPTDHSATLENEFVAPFIFGLLSLIANVKGFLVGVIIWSFSWLVQHCDDLD